MRPPLRKHCDKNHTARSIPVALHKLRCVESMLIFEFERRKLRIVEKHRYGELGQAKFTLIALQRPSTEISYRRLRRERETTCLNNIQHVLKNG